MAQPVEAASATAAAIALDRPAAILLVGIAGARRSRALPPATIVIGSDARYADLGVPASLAPSLVEAAPGLVDAAARVLGIPVRRVFTVTWGVSAMLGAIGSMLLAPTSFVSPFMMFDPFLKGFSAAVLGGLDSLPGVIIGGIVIGVVEALFGGYVSTAFKSTVAFVIILLVLLVRPEGLLGRKYTRRV